MGDGLGTDLTPFNPCNLVVQFRQNNASFFVDYIYKIEDAFFICTVNYVLVQIYQCG